jgi:hypothetical protein
MAEEQNSEHVVSLLRYRMRDLTPPNTKEVTNCALLRRCGRKP